MMTRRNNEKTLNQNNEDSKSRQRNEDLSKQWNYEMLLYEAKLEDISTRV
jgi:hypothetical protein